MRRKTYILLLISILSLPFMQACNKGMGCPGVKSYTEKSQQKSNGKGEGPWTKKSKKKDKKKASSGIVPSKYAKKRDL